MGNDGCLCSLWLPQRRQYVCGMLLGLFPYKHALIVDWDDWEVLGHLINPRWLEPSSSSSDELESTGEQYIRPLKR